MTVTADRSASAGLSRALDHLGRIATLLLPLFLTHFRGVAEGLIDTLAIAFLIRSAVVGAWDWTRAAWFRASLVWWAWTVLCSLPIQALGQGGASLVQATVLIRLPVMVAALSTWTLRDAQTRRWMQGLVAGCMVYIAAQILLQGVTGYNLFGQAPPLDGTLSGPYREGRAAAPLSRLLPPVMLLACAMIEERWTSRLRRSVGIALVLLAGCSVMVLAGQRMPLLLTGFGLVVAGLLVREIRAQAVAALVAVPVFLAILSVVRPAGFFHLVMKFRAQMSDFAGSHYGLIYDRALVMASANPVTGLGYDAFRHHCSDPRFFLPGPFGTRGDGGGAWMCVQHTHNHYFEALTDSGIPGLVLFSIMVVAWLATLARGLGDVAVPLRARAWRVGLFVAVLIQEWPIASTSAFANMPLGGWAFLLLALGLGEYNAYMTANRDLNVRKDDVRDDGARPR